MRRALAVLLPCLLLLSAAATAGKPSEQAAPSNDRLFVTFVDPALSLSAEVVGAEVHFNPKEIGFDKPAPGGHWNGSWGDDPKLEFTHGKPHSLTLELMFDGYETKTDVGSYGRILDKYVALPDEKKPPVVTVTWGTGLSFKCVLESFSLRFTLFLEDGTPVRAVMVTTFKEVTPAHNETTGNPRH